MSEWKSVFLIQLTDKIGNCMVGERLQNSPFQSKKVLMRKSPNGIYPEGFAVMNREMMSSSLTESIPSTKNSGSLTRSSATVSERSLTSFGIVMQDAIMPPGQNARKHGDVRVLLGPAEDRKRWRIETP